MSDTPVSQSLEEALAQRILVLDGATGTMLQRQNLQEADYRGDIFADHPIPLKGNNDILSLTKPEAIEWVHRQYFDAGADIVETNSFCANTLGQAEYGTEAYCRDICVAAARVARRVADEYTRANLAKPRWVFGSIGPTNKTLSMSPKVDDASFRAVDFDAMAASYKEQISALIEGGVDALLFETAFDTLNLKAAIFAAEQCFDELGRKTPIVISATIAEKSGRTLCGQTVETLYASVQHCHPLAIGLNCALGAEQMIPHIEKLASLATCYISCYPNAGLPNAMGGYDETPEHMGEVIGRLARAGQVNIVGGCCGTNPDFIRAIAAAVDGLKPRCPQPVSDCMYLAGLESYTVTAATGFSMIGERTNLYGSAKFAKLIRAGDFDGALSIARQQVENGANLIDINLDDALMDNVANMTKFLRLLASEPEIAKVPVVLDSSHWDVIEAGLKNVPGRSLVNSISLKEGPEEFKRRARYIRRLGAIPVVMCFDEQGQGDTLARKMEICTRAYHILVDELGFGPGELMFDPAVLTVATGIEAHANFGADFIEAVRRIKRELPGARALGGISNVSFALRGNNAVREAINSAFLYHAIAAGLDMGIVNAGMMAVYQDIPPELLQAVEDVIFNRCPEATDRLLALAEKYRREPGQAKEENQAKWRQDSCEERLQYAMIHGINDYLQADLEEMLSLQPNPLRIIDGPLMQGMNRVGQMFGAGQMFLPQVVRSARVMNSAVAILTPFLEEYRRQNSDGGDKPSSRGRIVLATVKGDVHDIGKNIVSVILSCNGYEVVDLGVMVPKEEIVAKAQECEAQAVGLSSLITPSLEEMVRVAEALENAGLRLPLMVGGAATSKAHTAMRLSPAYSGPVLRVPDAAQAPEVLAHLLADDSADYISQVRKEYAMLAEQQEKKEAGQELWSLEEARMRAPKLDWSEAGPLALPFADLRVFDFKDWEALWPYLNWTQFFTVWGIKGAYPGLLRRPETAKEARKVMQAAQAMLERIAQGEFLRARGVWRFFPACSAGDDIELYEDGSRDALAARIPTLRQQSREYEECLALADYIAPKSAPETDCLGMFAFTTGLGLERSCQRFRDKGDEYSAIMLHNLADRLCEAMAEYMHREARVLWGIESAYELSPAACCAGKYRGIRPAPGYAACPDHSLKFLIWEQLQAEKNCGMTLTETAAMQPSSSVCGFIFGHPQARYFKVGPLGEDQLADYAERRGKSAEELKKWLAAY
ncbi:methionine synthase [bacterium]|nr:methionine synthase [bacterium]